MLMGKHPGFYILLHIVKWGKNAFEVQGAKNEFSPNVNLNFDLENVKP